MTWGKERKRRLNDTDDTTMRRATASLISIFILAAALSLPGNPSGAMGGAAAGITDGVAAMDTVPPGGGESGMGSADSLATACTDSTGNGGQRDTATPSSDFVNGVIVPPEQPEAAAFAPNMMGSIEPALPTAGISIIPPPSPNSRGSASLQYPFIMPPARNGMQPTLGLAYDSDGGDGVCGEGWSMPVSSVTVDTRWGVPRYSLQHETETYLLDGRMLAMQDGSSLHLAHRNPNIPRNATDTRHFHPRTGTDFSLIERLGNSPSNYTWKVTATDGTEYTYGTGNAKVMDTITDASGARREVIAEWLLSRMEEPHGDYVTYEYATRSDPAVGGLRSRSVVLTAVRAGHADGTEHTAVTLHYRSRDGGDMHPCSARYGFLTSCNHLLDSVTVLFRGSVLRSYGLRYTGGRFGRKLLSRVTHYGSDGTAASFQDFSYYDDVSGDGTSLSLFPAEAVTIPSAPTGVEAGFAQGISDAGGFSQHPTTLGGSTGTSTSVSLYAGVGLGVSNDKANTAGASAAFSRSTVSGGAALADLTGDGLPDLVYRLGGVTYCRPMAAGGTGLSLGSPVVVEGAPAFSKSVTTSVSGGMKAHAGIGRTGIAELSVPADFMSSTTKTTAYMTDVNADGLTDIVSNGKVHFGYMSGGAPAFSVHSSATPSPVACTGTVLLSEDSLLSAECDTLRKYSPMQDMVRVWKAPFAGTVNITGAARLLLPDTPTGEDGEPVSPDGVLISIQKAGTVLHSARLTTTSQVSTNRSSVTVAAGDTLFFRVQCGSDSLSNGWHDRVRWTQAVTYQEGCFPHQPNGDRQHIYKSAEAAFVSSGTPLDVGGRPFTVRGTLTKPKTTDYIYARVWLMNERYDTLGNANPSYQRTLAAEKAFGTASRSLAFTLSVPNSGGLRYAVCEIYSCSNVKWPEISWIPKVVIDGDTTEAVPHYATYPVQRWRGAAYRADSADSLVITPEMAISGTHTVNMTVKKRNNFLGRARLEYVNGVLTGSGNAVRVRPSAGDSIWVEYFIEDDDVTACPSQPRAIITKVGAITSNIRHCNLFHYADETPLGTMYRGWGAFSYSAGDSRCAQPIDRSLLALPTDSSAAGPTSLAFMPLTPVIRDGHTVWQGASEGVRMYGDTLSAARLSVNDVCPQATMPGIAHPPTEGADGSEGRGITLMTQSTGRTLTASGGTPALTLTVSSSTGSSVSSTAFTDMNGDGYPDIVSGGRIQYTGTSGGFTDEFYSGLGSTEAAGNASWSMGLGAAAQHSRTFSGRRASGGAETSAQQARNARHDFGSDSPHGSDNVEVMLSDINGDGLPDRLRAAPGKIWVRVNLGYSFSEERLLTSLADSMESTSHVGLDASAGLSLPAGFDHGATSFAGGLSTAAVQWSSERLLADINGDGIPDLLRRCGGVVAARLGSGSGFLPPEVTLAGLPTLGSGGSTTMSGNLAATLSFTALGAKVAVTPAVSTAATMTRTTAALRDIDGDGFPDLATSGSESGISARLSTIRRTNRLKTVTNSLGGAFTLDYAHTAPTYGLPGGKWVLSSVEVDRGIHFPGYDIPVTRTAFSYSGGVRDRREREFLGFAEVVSTDLDTRDGDTPCRSVTDSFDVSSYYRRGLLLSTTLRDAQGNRYTEAVNTYYTYSVRPDAASTVKNSLSTLPPSDLWPVAYTPTRSMENRRYEGGASSVRSQTAYKYNTFDCGGMSNSYTRWNGSLGIGSTISGYDCHTKMAYKSLNAAGPHRMVNLPYGLYVEGSDGVRYRKDIASYDNAGRITSILHDAMDAASVRVNYGYDPSGGNLVSVQREYGSGYTSETFTYEDSLHTYPCEITDMHGLMRHVNRRDYRYGTPVKITDENNGVMYTINDALGRLTSVSSPGEEDSITTAAFSYHQLARTAGGVIVQPAYAVTKQYMRRRLTAGHGTWRTDSAVTVTFTDGFGQPIQTRREGMVTDSTGTETRRAVVEGRLFLDGLGRAVRSYHPSEAPAATLMAFDPSAQLQAPFTTRTLDVLDRPLAETEADGSQTTYQYSLIADSCLRTIVTSPHQRQRETQTDAGGRVLATIMQGNTSFTHPIMTRYLYDHTGRLTGTVSAAAMK